jgi:PhnB protein
MTGNVKTIPDGYQVLMPYLIVKGAKDAIEYYKRAFGAVERMRMDGPNGTIGHAELMICGATIMISDACPDSMGPRDLGGSPVGLHLYVEDVDMFFNNAIFEGGRVLHSVQDKFYGDRSGTLQDPYGHIWHISTHIKDVSHAEMKKAMEGMKQPV